MVFSNALNVFAINSFSALSILQSTVHELWARYYGSTLETRNRYNPTDCFETFPWVTGEEDLNVIGEAYQKHRRQIMLAMREGLTDTYNRFHNPSDISEGIIQLRLLHVEMDNAVAAAYGWSDLDLRHDFYEIKEELRFTLCEAARREILGRLLALNHERYAEEVKAGLHDKGAKAKAKASKKTKAKAEPGVLQPSEQIGMEL